MTQLSPLGGCELSCMRNGIGIRGSYVDHNGIHGGCVTSFQQGTGSPWESNTVYPAQTYYELGGGPYDDGKACPQIEPFP